MNHLCKLKILYQLTYSLLSILFGGGGGGEKFVEYCLSGIRLLYASLNMLLF